MDGTAGRGAATKLADLPHSAVQQRGVLAGDALIWEEYVAEGKDAAVIKRLSLRDGKVGDVPGSRGYWLSTIPGWITSQYGGSPFGGVAERAGTIVEVATGRRLQWKSNDEMVSSVYCGPDWCTGWNVANSAAIQDLDGGDYVDLKQMGSLSPGLEGRLATGQLGQRQIVWDRGSGRAAEIKQQGTPGDRIGAFDPAFSNFGDWGEGGPIRVWLTQDGTPMMLDLKRLW
ncbi:hypothetical protein Pflav_002220 [Phytohabitans flavus]|uniref:Uncharacterized protein n=1 Tax=Phytohabitans flavus TaxID=1076124 RepID=A0A6F8XJ24_9ACTN|nr:hypothetical protein Pflav_002220 [Phytohabitans flavus]